jgi:hypothetical protein
VKSVHDKIKDNCCSQCDFKKSHKAKLKSHVVSVHGHGVMPQHTRASSLKFHVKSVHDKIKDNCCSQCDFKTSHKVKLKSSVHGCYASHVCHLCNKAYSLKSQLANKCDI